MHSTGIEERVNGYEMPPRGLQDRCSPRGGPADQVAKLIYAKPNFFRMVPASPVSPLPNNNAAAGNGTGAGVFTTLPLKTLVLLKGVPVPLSVAAKRSVSAP